MTPPATTGYADVNGLRMYYEVRGEGRPLVLLHGGVHTIELSFGALLEPLSTGRRTIAVELQGHGRTADTGRELSYERLAADVVALLDVLGIERADVFGYSFGGLTALQTAIGHPERVDRLVLAAVHYRADGYHPEITDPAQDSPRLPTEADFADMVAAYRRVAPDPDHFDAFMARMNESVHGDEGWPEEALRGIAAPTLLILGDTDFIRLDHAVRMHELIPDARLAVLPGTTHMEVVRRAELVVPMVDAFLAR
ncbi:alpha/beta fold hydrolase [Allonocardiopsis opalescens]|uniref:Pimeloyl-ACP methyl ester carboxylesterase n=1 Tax=Allonocardiopsis opalescens TaxID=1144618 RepID=A0A2T0Q840_9ACTN|nr:alpha/beta fold hydrolase [Allonocardiopsis opalescens]PRY00018.1 pimeloyl-ACP methyl ester carboxylesterase [Allonocardiopsis opalescens]